MYLSLPPSIRILILVLAVMVLAFYSIKSRIRKEPFSYFIFGISGTLGAIFAAMYEAISAYMNYYDEFTQFFKVTAFLMIGILIISGIVGVYKYGDERKDLVNWCFFTSHF